MDEVNHPKFHSNTFFCSQRSKKMSGWHEDQEWGSNAGKANGDAAEDEEQKEMVCVEDRNWLGVRQTRMLADCGGPRGERSLMGSQAQERKGVNWTIEERDDCLQGSRWMREANSGSGDDKKRLW